VVVDSLARSGIDPFLREDCFSSPLTRARIASIVFEYESISTGARFRESDGGSHLPTDDLLVDDDQSSFLKIG
jgi:hypothetical protein